MKKITKKLIVSMFLLLTLLTFSFVAVTAQDVVVFKHTNYTTSFSKSKKYPVLVEWWITRAKVGCPTPLARVDAFQPDPQDMIETDVKKDYVGSGLDRGHNMPAAENQCQGMDVQIECFYMSNMAPQYHSLNAGDWKSVEVFERDLAMKNDSVHVWCGSVGESKKIGKVSVPTQCWKVIYVKKNKEYLAFLFNNTIDKPTGIESHKVDVKSIEKLTGFKFH